MVKERPWVPATLKEVGGTKGVGVAFLEETFNGRTANPNHRLHQKAARAALRTFVSDDSGNIKGSMRHYGELRVASGYEQHPKDFDSLLAHSRFRAAADHAHAARRPRHRGSDSLRPKPIARNATTI